MSVMTTATFADLVPALRAQFPALRRTHAGQPVIYLDGPAGSQVPQTVIDAISDYYQHHNANRSGKFDTSRETDQLMHNAHCVAADWFGVDDPDEVIFGGNMTTLTFQFSRALAKTWKTGDRIVVSQLDHDANVTPWRLAAQDAGVEVSQVRINPEDATLDIAHFRELVTPGVKLVAFTCASNSVGSKTPIKELIEIAHAVGAEVYLDAVHWAPHCLIDVNLWDADYCICSAYKFFGPHVGVLWGRKSRLQELVAYKLRPAPQHAPGKWMTGTQNHAAICGVAAAMEYVASIGELMMNERLQANPTRPMQESDLPASELQDSEASPRSLTRSIDEVSRRTKLQQAFAEIEAYEGALAKRLINGLLAISGVTVYGITAMDQLSQRVPTVAINIHGLTSAVAAGKLAERGIFCWHGDYYAVDVCQALGQQPAGMIRLGLMHTNTMDEVHRTLAAIRELARGG